MSQIPSSQNTNLELKEKPKKIKNNKTIFHPAEKTTTDNSKVSSNLVNKEYINFYEHIPEELKITYYNPNKQLNINHPFRCLFIGGTGSGKSNTILNLIHQLGGAVEQILVFAALPDEPLYETLKMSGGDKVKICTSELEELPEYQDNIWKQGQTLVIFDDMITKDKRAQKKISDLFIMGRKLGNMKGVSVVYATQKATAVLPIIRDQLSHLIIKGKIPRHTLLKMHSDCSVTCIDKEKFYSFCQYSTTRGNDSFVMIDKVSEDPKYQIREGFYGID